MTNPMTDFSLTRKQRNQLIREGHKYNRQHGPCESFEIAEHLFGLLLDADQYGTEPYPATEISDYAYGVARFVVGGDW